MMPSHPPKDQYFQRAALWARCLLTLLLSLGWAWAGAEQEMRDLAVNSWPDALGQPTLNSAIQVKIFQLGVAATLLVWSLVQWTLSYKRLYAIISMTLVFFLGRLLAQSEQLTNYLDLSGRHNHLLLMLFSVGYAMNALYLLHLLLTDSDKQTQRKKVFYAAYAATILVEAALLLMPSGNFIPAAVGLFVSVLGMIVWDFGESLKDKSVPVSVFRLRWIVLGVALSIFAFNLL
jgi:hypothetical protein